MKPRDVAVIIPTWNEAANLSRSVESARACGAGEIIVCDGGSEDQTLEVAASLNVDHLVESKPGRGTQLATGLDLATTRYVLLLHADNRIAKNSLDQICESVNHRQATQQHAEQPHLVWGAFRQRIESARGIYRWIEWGNAARVRYKGMAFGDQAIFAHRQTLLDCGGIASIPLMEDVELSKRLRRIAKPVLLDGPVEISARRWQQTGVIRQTIRNWWIQLRFAAGTSPDKLAEIYRSK